MKWALLVLGPMLVTLAGSFGISLLVVEWRGADGEDQIRVSKSAEWVACQVYMVNQMYGELEEGKDVYLTTDVVRRMRDECRITSDMWVLCVHNAMLDLPEEEYAAFGTQQALNIAEECEQQVR